MLNALVSHDNLSFVTVQIENYPNVIMLIDRQNYYYLDTIKSLPQLHFPELESIKRIHYMGTSG